MVLFFCVSLGVWGSKEFTYTQKRLLVVMSIRNFYSPVPISRKTKAVYKKKTTIIYWTKWPADIIDNGFKKEVLSKHKSLPKYRIRVNVFSVLYWSCPRLSWEQASWGSVPDTAAQKQLASSATAERWARLPGVLTPRAWFTRTQWLLK